MIICKLKSKRENRDTLVKSHLYYTKTHRLLVSGGNWWTGAIKDRNKNIWVWDHSDSELVFTNWDSKDSQPNGESKEKDENCVLSELGFWHDYPCQDTFNMICER